MFAFSARVSSSDPRLSVMLAADRGDDHDVGTDRPGMARHLAFAVDLDLEHAVALAGPDAQHGQRHQAHRGIVDVRARGVEGRGQGFRVVVLPNEPTTATSRTRRARVWR